MFLAQCLAITQSPSSQFWCILLTPRGSMAGFPLYSHILAFIIKIYQHFSVLLIWQFLIQIQYQMTHKSKPLNILCLLLLLVCFSKSAELQASVTNLNTNWEFEILSCIRSGQDLIGQKFTTNLPSTIHLDLLKHKKIEDPFYRNNYPNVQWASSCTIKYSKKFVIKPEQQGRTAELVFHGIDTYANVTLNGKKILKTNNAFVRYSQRVEKLLKKSPEENLLVVVIEPVEQYDQEGQGKNNMPFKYAHSRKACYQYSWDWAPELVSIGIWKDVELKIWDEVRIDYIWVRNKVVSQDKVILNFATKLQTNLFKNEPLKNYALKIFNGEFVLATVPIVEDTVYSDVVIENPEFWWPNGIGKPNLYAFKVELLHNLEIVDKKEVIYGIRTVELDLTNKQFKVVLNGYPIYCKGANYVPLDMFHPRITNKDFQTEKTYTMEKLFDDVVSSNFNMIRLWGGGQYESDEFLQLASRKGIMIFYDFMFSDSIYPSNKQFLHNVEEEIKQQIRRARNYPALALWSGNNQILQGIQDWGWGAQNYRRDYKLLFETLIPKIINIESPDISYIPSSPIYGVGNYGFERGGDFHYWSVWAGGSPFQSYQSAVGPFNSQFGTQALPVWESIKQFTAEEDRSYSSSILLSHERHNSQFGTLRNYINMYAKPSKDFESEAYLSGVIQAMGIEIAIIAQRTAKPKSYGTLYWQFNDAWPAISWSAIDYYGRWKALQFMAKRSFTNIAVFTQRNGSIIAINDNLEPVDVVVKFATVQFTGEVISKDEKALTLEADSTRQVFTLNQNELQPKMNRVVTVTEIYYQDKLQTRTTKYYKPFKDLELPQAKLSCSKGNNDRTMVFKSNKLIKNLFVNYPGAKLSDNYFDVVPGYPVSVEILSSHNLSQQWKENVKFMSVRQSNEKANLSVEFNF